MINNLENTILAGIVGIILASIFTYFIKKTTAPPSRKPPIATGGWPIIGHLPLLANSHDNPPHITLGDLSDKHGPIFTIKIGVHSAIVINTWELAKECFTTLDLIVSSRPKFTAAKIMGHNYASFAFAPYGEFWTFIRKITASELLSARRFVLLRDIRDYEMQSSLKELYKEIESTDNKNSGFLVEMKQWLGDMNLNVILRMIAGKRYSGEGEEEIKVRRIRSVLRDFFRLTGLSVVGDAIPFLGWLDLGGQVKEMKKTAKEMDGIVCEWLEEHRRRKYFGDSKKEQDFIDVLLSVLDGVDLDGFDPDTVIKATCLAIIAGATDTTTVTVIWALSLLLNNRIALKKVQDELDEHVGEERLVNESDISNLIYLQAVVKETLRLYPAAPLTPREFTKNCTLDGYHIQKGTRMILNIWKLHRDPRVWSDPLKFQPERFLTIHKGMDVKGKHFELLPFGGGRRSCPGISFGLQMTHMALAAFLQAFEVTTPSSAEVDMSVTFGLTNIKTTPLEVLAKPRLSYNLFDDEDCINSPQLS